MEVGSIRFEPGLVDSLAPIVDRTSRAGYRGGGDGLDQAGLMVTVDIRIGVVGKDQLSDLIDAE